MSYALVVEPEIQALARKLLAASEPREPFVLTPEWLQERLLEWATADPDFRVKLLRFVDVLPTLRSPAAVADHIRQYFRGPAPAFVHLGSELATQPLFRPVVSQVVRQGVYAMAHRFIAGESPEAAVPRLRELAREGVAYTVDLLGEATLSEVEADVYLKRYLDLIETLTREAPVPGPQDRSRFVLPSPPSGRGVGGEGAFPASAAAIWQDVPRVNISIKLSALCSQFEPAAPEAVSAKTRERLRPLLRAARDRGAFINVDVEQYRFKDLVHRIFADVMTEPEFTGFSDVGIVVQAYLRDAEQTVPRLRALAERRGAAFSVRLVKGAYWEEERIVASQNSWEVPVFEDKALTDLSYERCTDALLAAWPHLRPAFGTHNHRSIAQAAVKAGEAGLAKGDIEFQMLYGMADELRAAVEREGYRTRVYAPVGLVIPGMAYLVRRLLENTSNQSWFLREANAVSPDELVAPPAADGHTGIRASGQVSAVVPLREAAGPAGTPVLRLAQHALQEHPSRRSLEPPARQEELFLVGRSLEHPELVEGPGQVPHLDEAHLEDRSPVFHNAPPAPFHEPAQREEMAHALYEFERALGRTYPLLIDGRRVEARELDEVRYPADPSRLVGRVAQATTADIEAAVSAAREAFPAWRDLPAPVRAEVLRQAAVIMAARRYELVATMVYESAKPWHEADGDVAEAIDYLNYYAAEAERLGDPRRLGHVLGEDNQYILEARGVAAVIAPWNFPLAIICGMSSAAIAAGNCAILKPAAQSPIIAYKLVEVLHAAGVPAAVAQYLPGPGASVGQALVEHPGVDIIAFTGSKEVGLDIVARAAQTRAGQRGVKRVIAEMGGKNAIIVDDDADLDQAVAGVVVSAFGYAGQKCSACSRLIVVGSAYDEVIARLGPAVESLVAGPPHDPASFVPPVISAAARAKIQSYIERGKQTATLLVQGMAGEGEGYYVRPTVFTEVDPNDPLARDEIFGPVLSVFRAADFDAALRLALDSDFALTGGLFSRNPRHIEQARREFRVGDLYINRKITGAIVGRQPFGGLRLSGVGDKAGGPDYLLQFLEPRVVAENTMRRGFAPS